jgi:hypothetical protein
MSRFLLSCANTRLKTIDDSFSMPQGTANAGAKGVTFTGTYDSAYDIQTPVSALAGNYSGASAVINGSSPMTLTVHADGSISGSAGTSPNVCDFSGTIAPRATGKAIYNLTVKYQGGACSMGTSTVSGYGIADTTGGGATTLYAVGLLPDRSDGFLGVATKTSGPAQ